MFDHYVKQQVGVADGTVIPAKKADGREVGAATRAIFASKVTGTIWANGDTIYLGKKPDGHKIVGIQLVTDTSLGTSTVSIGDGTTANKYVNAKTLTATDTPTNLGPKADAMDDDPAGEEDIVATIGVADIAAATKLTFVVTTAGIN